MMTGTEARAPHEAQDADPSAAATLAAPSIVRAQAWPANPIRVIHGYDAGSNPDTIARHLSVPLTEILGVQIVIEPKPGAAERLAATQIARMKPDGSVLYLMTGGQAVVSATDRTLSYDVLRDFDFIAIVTRFPFVFTVAPESRFKTIQAYVDEAKRRPGETHLRHLGRRLDPAHGDGTAAVADRRQDDPCAVQRRPAARPTTILSAAGSTCRSSPSPTPSPAEDRQAARAGRHLQGAPSGVPRRADGRRDVGARLRRRVMARLHHAGGLPPALRDRLNEALRQAMARPEIKGKLEELGNDTRVSTPSEFRARVEQDMARWRPLAHVVNQS